METRDHVNLDEWLDVWGKLLETARALDDLPLWLQYFPKIIFQVINKSGSQKISKEELRAFYTMFLGIDFRVVNETLDSIYNAMTDKGKNPITYRLFKLCFANFLLGRYPHGPGQFLFGICSPQSLHCNFPIDYSAMNTPADDLEPYDPNRDKDHSRRSQKNA
ncbi:Sarcoplasmic calcium-binding proteins II, V, VI, and VII [Orchesella cincta]|uniref:Sarcoplasmic calcium-binding proteins II, V, VI, and VII n=1 Tax=Orchesella cincta TaxID=48709 RepID=A0A1D2N807_ORCCI|nr:Sarcoplasmic calcium-binding proteins II, V, VI, and VII [Orchesella cincta]